MAAHPLAVKYEAMSLRERGLVVAAILGLGIASWDSLLMDPLRQQRVALESELSTAGASGFVAQSVDLSDPRQVNLQRAAGLQTQMQELDARISDTASGFVSSQKMIEVLNDVLDRQGRLELVSIRNLPVVSLIPPAETGTNADGSAAAAEPIDPAKSGPGLPPYIHAIEIVIDGQYADILDYLQSLEALPWKFRWSTLDLNTTGYPRNRVRIELSTLSLDSTWLGVGA
jgi:MSHA biogenesis protein MshJ